MGLERKGEERGVAMLWTIYELMCTTANRYDIWCQISYGV